MKIEKARGLGLCSGVKRAIKLLEDASNKYGEIETLGPVAHNRQLVDELAQKGVRVIEELEQIQGKLVVITTHGASPEILSKINARHIDIIDTTCSIVRGAQNAAKRLAEAGFDVIVFGEPEHSEVKGLLGWAGGKGIATISVEEINLSQRLLHRLGIISQTTQSQSAFIEFTKRVIATFGSEIKEMHIIKTLCKETQRRQEAAVSLAQRSQLMIVIGGYDSANTRRLAEVCSSVVETHLVESANEIDGSWFVGKHRIGVTAGASTPDEAIRELTTKLESLRLSSIANF